MSAISASCAPYAPGYVLAGRYELESLVGEGAVGQVWVARSRALGTRVAVKLCAGAAGERFIHEARAAAQLEHPAIVRMFDFGETESGEPFLVMELLRGESLEDMLARGPLNPARTIQILLPLVDALHAAHVQGIVHRDIKPANLFLARPDPGRASQSDIGATQWLQPKVIDFGLVKRWREDDAKLTPSGILVGSPAYMAPELVKGGGGDTRADVWSLSVVLYELLTGRLPFSGTTQFAMFEAIVNQSPRSMQNGIDATLTSIVLRGLSKDPDARWQSMFDLGVALASWLVEQGVNEDAAGASVRATWIARLETESLTPRVTTPRSEQSNVQTTMEATRPVDVLVEGRKNRRSRWLTFAAFGAAASVALVIAASMARSSRSYDAPRGGHVDSTAVEMAVAPLETTRVTATTAADAIVQPAPAAIAIDQAKVAEPKPAPQDAMRTKASTLASVSKPIASAKAVSVGVRDPELGF